MNPGITGTHVPTHPDTDTDIRIVCVNSPGSSKVAFVLQVMACPESVVRAGGCPESVFRARELPGYCCLGCLAVAWAGVARKVFSGQGLPGKRFPGT